MSLEVTRLATRKKIHEKAKSLLKVPLFLSEPIKGIQEPEINYYGFTFVNLLNSPVVNSIHLSRSLSDTTLPVVWNYLDGACAITVGLSQLLDEEDYRQDQMKVKGLLNIFSGIQLLLLSYNPQLTAALGVTGAPTALASASFALATMVDLITASIDFYNVSREKEINGWFEEKCKEYQFLNERVTLLEKECQYFQAANEEQLLELNHDKIQEIREKQRTLRNNMTLRYKVNKTQVGNEQKKRLLLITQMTTELEIEATGDERFKDGIIQKELDELFQKTRDTLLIKAASCVGMSLIAIGTFYLYMACPPAVAIVGLSITVVVASIYLYRHQQELINKLDEARKKIHHFFKPTPHDPVTNTVLNAEDSEVDLIPGS